MSFSTPPFSESAQLCTELDIHYDNSTSNSKNHQMSNSDDNESKKASLPGHPSVMLGDAVHLEHFLEAELLSHDLETIAPRLWILSTQSSTNINALHRQKVKGREIVITEDPRLHLIWIRDRIFIKPLPRYLLSHAFWKTFLLDKSSSLADRQEQLRKSAAGYLRTYRHLIRHESDFAIAQQDHLRLIPRDVDWPRFCRFISQVACIEDADVSGRYQYGELRLSRLNFYAPFLLGKAHYEHIQGQYAEHFARLYVPVLFLFAVVTTILNAMQVNLAVDQVTAGSWTRFWPFCRWFSILSLFGTVVVALCFIMLWSWMVSDEWVFAVKNRLARSREKRKASAVRMNAS